MKHTAFRVSLLLGVLCLFYAIGCKKTDVKSVSDTTPRQNFLIGLIPEQNLFKQIQRYEPLAAYLSDKTGLRITLTILPKYGNVIENFRQRSMDAAFFGSFTYTLAHAKFGVEVIARPQNLDGTSEYRGLIFVRKDSGIRTAAQMRRKRFAFVDRATTAGFLFPRAYFKEHGFDYRTHLREFYFSGTHEDTIYDVLTGKADIGAAKDSVFERLATGDARIENELKVLTQSPPVPENALAVRKGLDQAVKQKLKVALLDMENDTKGRKVLADFGAKRFIRTTDADYEPVYRYAVQADFDPAGYDRNQ